MKIETLYDWNVVNAGCGCCPMPTGSPPAKLSESIEVNLPLLGRSGSTVSPYEEYEDLSCSITQTRFKKVVFSDEASASDGSSLSYMSTTTYFRRYNDDIDDLLETNATVINTDTATGSNGLNGLTITETYSQNASRSSLTFTEVITGTSTPPGTAWFITTRTVTMSDAEADPFSSLITEADTYIDRALADPFWEPNPFRLTRGFSSIAVTEALSRTTCEEIFPSEITAIKRRLVSYRWRIPHMTSWGQDPNALVPNTGVYFKITWDVATEPDQSYVEQYWNGTAWVNRTVAISSAPATLQEDLTWEWSGPGTGDIDDPSWLSGDYFLLPPDEPGIRKIVNVRYESYRSTRIGMKPQLLGEAYELPPSKSSLRTPPTGKDGSTAKGGKSGSNGLKIGGLRVGGLKMNGLKMSGLKMGGLKINSLQMGNGLRFSALESSSGLKSSGLRFNSLESSGGLKTSGLKVSGLQGSSGIRVSGIQTSRLQSSSGLQRSGGLRSSGGLRRGRYSL